MLLSIFFSVSCYAILAACHSWVEQLSVIDNGAYVGGFGYPRGYVARTDAGFTGQSDNYLLPPLTSGRTKVDGSDLLCHPAQRDAKQSSDRYPRLQAKAGNYVAFRYLENGHVTLPDTQKGKPANGGTVLVFGTEEPRADEKLTEVLKWTADGSGGDRRGRLLTSQNFDDGRCYQINGSKNSKDRGAAFTAAYPDQPDQARSEQWCETDVKLPDDVAQAKPLAVYWVWQWPTLPGQDPGLPTGKDEVYTTCADIDIVSSPPSDKAAAVGQQQHKEVAPKNALVQQNLATAAVSGYKTRAAVANAVQGSNPTASPRPTAAPAAPATPALPAQATHPVSFTVIVVTRVETFTIPLPAAAATPSPDRHQKRSEAEEGEMVGPGSAKFRR